jgi:serine phosphatase RsbU (regulator of sigma subunit)
MAAAVIKPKPADLIIDSPGSASMRVHLDREQYRLGRSSVNELAFLEDQKLSREHLVFDRTSEGWTVRDVGSRNGTHINGARLTGTACLSHGDRITAGHLTIRYDTRSEFADAGLNAITFVEQPLEGPAATVSIDLKAALETSTGMAGRPSLENEHLGALVRAGRELAGHGDLEKLFDMVLDLSLMTVKASRGVVMTLESEANLRNRAVRGEGLRISTAVRDLVMNEGRSVLVRDARLDQDFGARNSIVAQEIRSILAVPLQTDERVIGLLYLDSPHFVREFTAEDLNLVTVMANIAAIRIEHARLTEQEQARKLMARELDRAAEIQRRLLPSGAPEIPGFDLAGYNAPCRTVGGDYYDFLIYPDGRVALLIGDVSGKGLGAALLMSSLQARVHVLFDDPELVAGQIGRLNRSIAANCPGNCFITLFAAVLDPATGNLVYSNAGHNPPLLVHANGSVELLEATGLPLGISRDASYEQNSCRLEHGDVLVLFSDGVTEACAPDADEDFGEQRLVGVVQRKRNSPAASLIEAINTEVLSFTAGAAAADDITLVIARRS